ncbi:MAG: NAD(+)/NADH kinase [Coriobacteriales bacterium]
MAPKVLLIPSVNPAAREHARLLGARLAVAGIDAAVHPADQSALPSSLVEELALAVPMGGDGTFLSAARALGFAPVPLLGLNYGDLGFLSGNPSRDELDLIVSALAGELPVERRSTLTARLRALDGTEQEISALNEVAYTRGASGHVVEYTLGVNGIPVARLRADGLVISTATGSTAYALSAGGPIVSPRYSGLVAVPLAPHALSSRAIVTAPSDIIEVTMGGRNMEEASVFVDGIALDIRGVQSITVARGASELMVVQGGDDFFKSVSQVFFNGGELRC